jgi:hypothetical protein
MKRRFDKARAYHRRTFVSYTHPRGFRVGRTFYGNDMYYEEFW